jgi:hypothetical protein
MSTTAQTKTPTLISNAVPSAQLSQPFLLQSFIMDFTEF